MSAELIELSNALAQATDHAAASVVAVHTEARGSSSGVIWREGVIVTAEHALRRDEEIQATLPNGRVVAATLAGRDPSTDLAILKCPDTGGSSADRGDAAEVESSRFGGGFYGPFEVRNGRHHTIIHHRRLLWRLNKGASATLRQKKHLKLLRSQESSDDEFK